MDKKIFEKANNTKEAIIVAAKSLFYDRGYDDVTVKEICEVANVNTGLFSYYFKRKNLLAGSFYENLLVKCYSFVENKEANINSVQKNTRAVLIYYLALLRDENTKRFHRELLNHQTIHEYMAHNLSHIYKRFVKDLELDISEGELYYLSLADSGLRKEIMTAFLDDPKGKSVLDFVNTIHLLMGRLFKIDEPLMKSYLFEAMEFERNNDYSNIKFLI